MALQKYSKYKICISPKSAKRQGLRIGDVVRRQYFDGKNSIYSLMTVLETGTDIVTTLEGEEQESPYFAGALLDGDVPQNGQILDFVRVTNLFDSDRSGAMYLTASDSDAPYMDVIDGMAQEKSLYLQEGIKRIGAGESFVFPVNGTVRHPERMVIAFKIRASGKLTGVPLTFGYVDGNETDGADLINISAGWEYKLSLITIDYPGQYDRHLTLAPELTGEDWCELKNLNIIRLSDIVSFADSTKTRIGKLQGIIDPTFGKLDGYGAYFRNLYATCNVGIAGTLTAGDESGFASTFYVGRIHKNCLINSSSGNFPGTVEKAAGEQPPAGIGDVFLIPAAGVTLIAQTQNWAEAHQGENTVSLSGQKEHRVR